MWSYSVHALSLRTGELLRTFESDAFSEIALTSDGKLMALADPGAFNALTLWDVATGARKGSLVGVDRWNGNVVFNPNGKTMASQSEVRPKGPSENERAPRCSFGI